MLGPIDLLRHLEGLLATRSLIRLF